MTPEGAIAAAVFLISDKAGWSEKEDALAKTLTREGALVIGIDLPAYLASLSKDDGDCIYMVSDIEALEPGGPARRKERRLSPAYRAGVGAGGALALAIAAQTPAATFGQTIAVDPEAGIALTKQLCTPADKQAAGRSDDLRSDRWAAARSGDRAVHRAAPADGRAHVATVDAKHSDIQITETDDDMLEGSVGHAVRSRFRVGG